MLKTLVIGAQNTDIFAHTASQVNLMDSNCAKIRMAFGGVACNIACNISLLGNQVSFLTVFGDDTFSFLAKKNLENVKINFEESLTVHDASNSIYMAVMNNENGLYIGLNDMEIMDSLDVAFFQKKEAYISSFDLIVIDLNLRTDVLKYLLITYQNKQLVIDAVSAEKVVKLAGLLKYITLLKLNALELNAFSHKETTDEKIADLLGQGLKKILVTDEGNEIIYKSEVENIRSMPIVVDKIVNTSGAGDAFLGGFIHGIINEMSTIECLELGKKRAFLTLQSTSSISKKNAVSDAE